MTELRDIVYLATQSVLSVTSPAQRCAALRALVKVSWLCACRGVALARLTDRGWGSQLRVWCGGVVFRMPVNSYACVDAVHRRNASGVILATLCSCKLVARHHPRSKV